MEIVGAVGSRGERYGGVVLMKTCKKCNEVKPLGEFYASKSNGDGRQGACKECRNAITAEWVKAHPERRKVITAKYREVHPDRCSAAAAKYYRAHPETWRAYVAKRKAQKLACQGPHYTADDVAALLVDQHDLCAYCGVALTGKYDVDHVVPLSKGGGNGPDNIVLACPPCNGSKGSKSLLIWAMALGWRLQ